MKAGIRLKFFGLSLLLILLVIVVSGVVLEVRLTAWLDQRLENELVVQTRLASVIISELQGPLEFGRADSTAKALSHRVGARVTLILADGTVIGDSDLDPESVRSVENHGERPEFLEAMKSGLGVSRRYSATIGMRMLYVVIPLRRSDLRGVVRLALPLSEIALLRGRLRGLVLLAGLVGVVLAVLLSGAAAQLMSPISSNRPWKPWRVSATGSKRSWRT
jgi:two-component system phosphate regulon sensor histidine kinase PhoR